MREFSPSRFIWDKVAHVPLLWIDTLERKGEKTEKTWGKRSGEDREKRKLCKTEKHNHLRYCKFIFATSHLRYHKFKILFRGRKVLLISPYFL